MTITEARTLKNGDTVSWGGSDLRGQVFRAGPEGFAVMWNDGGCSESAKFKSPFVTPWVSKLSRVGPVEAPNEVQNPPTQEDPRLAQRNRVGALKVGDRVRYERLRPGGGTVVAKSEHSITFLWDINLRLGELGGSEWSLHDLNLAWDSIQLVDRSPHSEDVIHELRVNAEKQYKAREEFCAALQAQLEKARRGEDHFHRVFVDEVSKRIAYQKKAEAWEATAVKHARDTQYYRDLLLQIAEVLGPDKFICDDGSVAAEPLVAKIPELVHAAILGKLSEAVRNKLAASPMMVTEAPPQFLTGMRGVHEHLRQPLPPVVEFFNREINKSGLSGLKPSLV